MRFTMIVCMVLNTFIGGYTQVLKGTITDENKKPIPFASIYINELQFGTTSNQNGQYEITLEAGQYKLSFRSLSYRQVIRDVTIGNGSQTLDVILPLEVFHLNEVFVNNGSEDPAYSIMRKAIAWANYHLNQVQHYQALAYVKGTLNIDKVPKLATLLNKKAKTTLNGGTIEMKGGQTFLEEIVTDVTFDAPNKYINKEMSRKSSFPDRAVRIVSPNQTVNTSIYAPVLFGCISPLSPEAFKHYKFVYEGFVEEGSYIINKIKVIPRRASQTLFAGDLYIVDQYWCLHTASLSNEQFWGKVLVKELFAPVSSDAWLPVSIHMQVDCSIMGFKGSFKDVLSIKYSGISINKKLTGPPIIHISGKPAVPDEKQKPKKLEELEKLMSKDKLSTREMYKLYKASLKEEKILKAESEKNAAAARKASFDPLRRLEDSFKTDTAKLKAFRAQNDSARKASQQRVVRIIDPNAANRDSAYWKNIRAIPLTPEEQKSYSKRDSFALVAGSDTSIKKPIKTKPGFSNTIIFGRHWGDGKSTFEFDYSGLNSLKQFSFNTVDGFAHGISTSHRMNIDTVSTRLAPRRNIYFNQSVRYSVARRVWMPIFTTGALYSVKRNGEVIAKAGITSFDYNMSAGITPFYNSIMSLFFRENYMKLFENRFLSLGNNIDLSSRLTVNASVRFAEYKNLDNNSNFSFFFRNQKDYTPNIPVHDFLITPPPFRTRSFAVAAGLTYTMGQKKAPETSPGSKGENPPTLNIHYATAIAGVFRSNSCYHHLFGGISQNTSIGYKQSIDYAFTAGRFLNVRDIHFSERKHFNTQPLSVLTSGFARSFQLLDYYRYSTSNYYMEGHLRYETHLLLLKRLPWISNRIWTENIYLNFLETPTLKNYTEAGYSLSRILIFEGGTFVSFENGIYKAFGIKVNVGIK